MRAPHFVVAVLVAAGAVASVFIIPRDRELALMYLKGYDYESAQLALESRLDGGDISAGIVIPLTRVYLEIGDFEAAVALMERFVALNPDHADAREELAQLYKQASRIYDYVATLAELARLRPTVNVLRELSSYYADHGEAERQLDVLRVLVRQPSPRMEDWMDLAQVEAGLGNYDQAAAALAELDRGFTLPRTQSTVEFFISVFARTGREADALEMARDWVRKTPSVAAALGVARQLAGARRGADALALLDGVDPALAQSQILFGERMRLALQVGRRELAFEQLNAAYAESRLPPEFDDDLIDLALERNLVPLALAIALRGSPMRLPDWQLTALVGVATPERATVVAKWALTAPDLLERRPALAATVLKAVGDLPRALAMAERALADPADLSSDQLLGLVVLLADLGRADAARRHLAGLLDRFGWQESTAVDLANAMITLGVAEDGWRRVQAVRDRQRPRVPALDIAWALLSAATKRADLVIAWLDGPEAAQLDATLLAQLAYLAEAQGQPTLAVAAARRLIVLRDTDEARLQLASALLALDRPEEALAEVRPRWRNSADGERIYVMALATLAKRGAGGGEAELGVFWREALEKPGAAGEAISVLVYSLLDKGLGREALPAILWLAERLPDAWLSVVAEEAKKARRQADARSFLARQLARSDLAASAREQALFALLDVGGAAEALPEIARLAQGERSDNWFYAYMDAAKAAGRQSELRAFLAAEVRRTDLAKARRDARLYAYLELVGPEAALPELKRFAETYGGEWFGAYDEALAKLGRTEERRRLMLARAARPETSAAERREIAYALIELGDRNAAIGLFRDLAAKVDPSDPVVEELVFLWREAKQLPTAVAWLAARAASAPAADRPGWARRLFDAEAPARALAALGPEDAAETFETSALRVGVLIALRRTEEAGRIIAARAERERDVPRLRGLARQALDADSKPALRVVYGRLVREVPGDPEAERWLGLADHGDGRPSAARRRLAVVVDTPLADYEVNLAYGEILLQAGERDAAQFRFRQALGQIDAIRNPPLWVQVSRAQLLNRLGEPRQALAQMATLMAERPTDPGLRADYANLLMDNKLYDQARRVLAGE